MLMFGTFVPSKNWESCRPSSRLCQDPWAWIAQRQQFTGLPSWSRDIVVQSMLGEAVSCQGKASGGEHWFHSEGVGFASRCSSSSCWAVYSSRQAGHWSVNWNPCFDRDGGVQKVWIPEDVRVADVLQSVRWRKCGAPLVVSWSRWSARDASCRPLVGSAHLGKQVGICKVTPVAARGKYRESFLAMQVRNHSQRSGHYCRWARAWLGGTTCPRAKTARAGYASEMCPHCRMVETNSIACGSVRLGNISSWAVADQFGCRGQWWLGRRDDCRWSEPHEWWHTVKVTGLVCHWWFAYSCSNFMCSRWVRHDYIHGSKVGVLGPREGGSRTFPRAELAAVLWAVQHAPPPVAAVLDHINHVITTTLTSVQSSWPYECTSGRIDVVELSWVELTLRSLARDRWSHDRPAAGSPSHIQSLEPAV